MRLLTVIIKTLLRPTIWLLDTSLLGMKQNWKFPVQSQSDNVRDP